MKPYSPDHYNNLVVTYLLKQIKRNVLALILFFEARTSVLLLLGSAQCNGINLVIISKEQSILSSFISTCSNSMDWQHLPIPLLFNISGPTCPVFPHSLLYLSSGWSLQLSGHAAEGVTTRFT